ncbi:carbohydrate ABC transporter permease [Paraclostridium benzoelyticum]|uniref:carbohydrate ABC transporter permease n=1 Tax=Paraclostridium benzoelyticum TaxID=1629550 RepID=UPI000B9F8BFB|nr:ABC transporter permease [Paraclostridium benzoelyticum]
MISNYDNKKLSIGKLGIYTILILGCLVTLIPFLWMISTSLKPLSEVFKMPPNIIPKKFRVENYKDVAITIPITRYFINSIIITSIITIGTLVTTILAAFAFSKFEFWGKELVFSILIGTMIVPSEVTLIPNYITIAKLGLINTYTGLTIPWIASVVSIFLLRQFFLTVPKSLYYAAKLDGCSDFKFLLRIMVPVSKPALITIALLRIVNSWNEFMWPLIVTNIPNMRNLPVGIMNFTTESAGNYNLMMAASTIVIMPLIIVYIFTQKHIILGITKSGIKG